MSKIIFFLSNDAMIAYAREVFTPEYSDIELVKAFGVRAVDLLQKRFPYGLDVVAARPGTAITIKQAKLNVSVVEIPITGFDIIGAVTEAGLNGKSLAIVAHSMQISGIDSVAPILGVKIRQYMLRPDQSFDEAVLKAYEDGADAIIGGARVLEAAISHNIPCFMIKVGRESLLQAAQEAKQIQQALEIEAAKRGLLSTILDYTSGGIITIDKNHLITAFNPTAQKLTKTKKALALGQSIEKILPQFQLSKVSDNKEEDIHRMVDINGTRVICNKVPIVVNGKSFGAVATFHEFSKIQQMEEVIRQEIYAQGHIAKFNFADILGNSKALSSVIETAKDFAKTTFNILILGETGTGKEVFAQSIHNGSSRSKGPFVAINCAALPAHILESELFGYVSGAFTGASNKGKPGLFEVAHGGTIFLDEIGEMDYANQGGLLRVLQERTVVRLGSYKVIPIDVRVIAATNKDLSVLVREKKFRDDLYYRLNVLSLELPTLKERKADIRLYAEAFLREFSEESGKDLILNPKAIHLLEEYLWPGNIRELKNLIQRIAATAKVNTISCTMVGMLLNQKKENLPSTSPKETRWVREISDALIDTKGNYSAAAKLLGIHRMTLRRRMKKLHMAEY